jgi:hypothetical protein
MSSEESRYVYGQICISWGKFKFNGTPVLYSSVSEASNEMLKKEKAIIERATFGDEFTIVHKFIYCDPTIDDIPF